MSKMKTVSTLNIQYESRSLADFISWVRENVPSEIPNEEVYLDFDIDSYGEYDLYGEEHTIIQGDLLVKIKE